MELRNWEVPVDSLYIPLMWIHHGTAHRRAIVTAL